MNASPITWDRLVRTAHWSLVSCVAANLFLLEEGDPPHRWAGYLASGIVLVRLLWGFIGSAHARFSDFFPTPSRLLQQWQAWRKGDFTPHAGHNPFGAVMMLSLLTLVLALGLTGWLMGTDRFWGEEWLEELHEGLANLLMGLVGLHALAAIIMSRLERVRLIRAMFTGRKEPL
ncbi:cytochrome b/b6 domain-containing protein [Leeia aquatica]|uniref:Cytochrome B n=1 Tax=Leeia aquatica TaxID=2725557 RepID=A0A847RU33_9NEIS|nr:cytochrome b/b6 domain-containing protein [Leeia aquatica]NLR74720.1 cytochrome B [Leeia aquatica]